MPPCSASPLRTWAYWIPGSGHLRHQAALASGLPTFVRAPYILGDLEHEPSQHSNSMGRGKCKMTSLKSKIKPHLLHENPEDKRSGDWTPEMVTQL